MGAKTWMLVYVAGNASEILKKKPLLDRAASTAFAQRLFPNDGLLALEDGDLSHTCPADDEIVVAYFPGLALVAAKEFAGDYPSRLPARFVDALPGHKVYLHAMHSAVDWFAYACWSDGKLQRSLSLSPDSGVLEDLGTRLPFEMPFWAGVHPAVDPDDADDTYPFVFHPLELGEAALLALFGYQLEGVTDAASLEPEAIALMRFKRGTSRKSFLSKLLRPWS
ncbi:MAG: DUF6928 family protein [Massilia sp.]